MGLNARADAKKNIQQTVSEAQITPATAIRCMLNKLKMSVTKISIQKVQIKGMMRKLILSYTIQQVILSVCTKFQNPRKSSS